MNGKPWSEDLESYADLSYTFGRLMSAGFILEDYIEHEHHATTLTPTERELCLKATEVIAQLCGRVKARQDDLMFDMQQGVHRVTNDPDRQTIRKNVVKAVLEAYLHHDGSTSALSISVCKYVNIIFDEGKWHLFMYNGSAATLDRIIKNMTLEENRFVLTLTPSYHSDVDTYIMDVVE